MTDSASQTTDRRWYVAQWPFLAWLETAIKLVALTIGIWGASATFGGEFAWPTGVRLVQLTVLALLSLGLVAAIFDRLAEREVVAMVFVVPNNLGHWGMTAALAFAPGPAGALVAFATLMLVGDLVKLVFIKVHNFQVRDTPRAVLYGLTLLYVVGYLVLLILEWMR
jgi:hypothetical protein